MGHSYEIQYNPYFPDGAALLRYDMTAHDLALSALRPDDTEPLTITPPEGFVLVKDVTKGDALHYGIPGRIVEGMRTQWSFVHGSVVSNKLWTSGKEPTDIDNHPNLILDAPLSHLPRSFENVPEGAWAGIEVDEAALIAGLVRVLPREHASDLHFEVAGQLAPYLQHT